MSRPVASVGRVFGPCPKCAGSSMRVSYHDAAPHCDICRDLAVAPISCRYEHCDWGYREHLAVHCDRCGYGWLEKPKDRIP